jgi:enoyl-CoA hydratase/carnithine racemase
LTVHVTLSPLKPGSALLTIRRLDNERNQINPELIDHLEAALHSAAQASLRALILVSGYEKLFSTGADVESLGYANRQEALDFSHRGKAVFGLLQHLPCVTICCLNGFTLGGGLELALHCDLRIASANARMGLPEINLGIIPGWGGTQLLPGVVGGSRALRMILSGEPVNAETALAWGLVDEVVTTQADLLPIAEKLASRFLDKPRGALGRAKESIYSRGDAKDNESNLFADAWDSSEREEGVAALIGKRRPVWPE